MKAAGRFPAIPTSLPQANSLDLKSTLRCRYPGCSRVSLLGPKPCLPTCQTTATDCFFSTRAEFGTVDVRPSVSGVPTPDPTVRDPHSAASTDSINAYREPPGGMSCRIDVTARIHPDTSGTHCVFSSGFIGDVTGRFAGHPSGIQLESSRLLCHSAGVNRRKPAGGSTPQHHGSAPPSRR